MKIQSDVEGCKCLFGSETSICQLIIACKENLLRESSEVGKLQCSWPLLRPSLEVLKHNMKRPHLLQVPSSRWHEGWWEIHFHQSIHTKSSRKSEQLSSGLTGANITNKSCPIIREQSLTDQNKNKQKTDNCTTKMAVHPYCSDTWNKLKTH